MLIEEGDICKVVIKSAINYVKVAEKLNSRLYRCLVFYNGRIKNTFYYDMELLPVLRLKNKTKCIS